MVKLTVNNEEILINTDAKNGEDFIFGLAHALGELSFKASIESTYKFYQILDQARNILHGFDEPGQKRLYKSESFLNHS
jgi:hypothetical protein